MAFKIRQNPFSAGAPPRTPLGELTTLPRPLVGWRGDTHLHTLPHSAPTHLRPSPCVPRIPARSMPMATAQSVEFHITVNILANFRRRHRPLYLGVKYMYQVQHENFVTLYRCLLSSLVPRVGLSIQAPSLYCLHVHEVA